MYATKIKATHNAVVIRQRRDVHLLLTAWEQSKARMQVRIGYFASGDDEPMPYDAETKRPECLPSNSDIVQRALKFFIPLVDRLCSGEDVAVLNKEKTIAIRKLTKDRVAKIGATSAKPSSTKKKAKVEDVAKLTEENGFTSTACDGDAGSEGEAGSGKDSSNEDDVAPAASADAALSKVVAMKKPASNPPAAKRPRHTTDNIVREPTRLLLPKRAMRKRREESLLGSPLKKKKVMQASTPPPATLPDAVAPITKEVAPPPATLPEAVAPPRTPPRSSELTPLPMTAMERLMQLKI